MLIGSAIGSEFAQLPSAPWSMEPPRAPLPGQGSLPHPPPSLQLSPTALAETFKRTAIDSMNIRIGFRCSRALPPRFVQFPSVGIDARNGNVRRAAFWPPETFRPSAAHRNMAGMAQKEREHQVEPLIVNKSVDTFRWLVFENIPIGPAAGINLLAEFGLSPNLPSPGSVQSTNNLFGAAAAAAAAGAAGSANAHALAGLVSQHRLLELSRFGLRGYDLAQHMLTQQGAVSKLLVGGTWADFDRGSAPPAELTTSPSGRTPQLVCISARMGLGCLGLGWGGSDLWTYRIAGNTSRHRNHRPIDY
uniref:Uncharacterized protein n=1 Tax=Anopheles atroparvus TaxID=41427 RepID=A0A182J848_ANOAO